MSNNENENGNGNNWNAPPDPNNLPFFEQNNGGFVGHGFGGPVHEPTGPERVLFRAVMNAIRQEDPVTFRKLFEAGLRGHDLIYLDELEDGPKQVTTIVFDFIDMIENEEGYIGLLQVLLDNNLSPLAFETDLIDDAVELEYFKVALFCLQSLPTISRAQRKHLLRNEDDSLYTILVEHKDNPDVLRILALLGHNPVKKRNLNTARANISRRGVGQALISELKTVPPLGTFPGGENYRAAANRFASSAASMRRTRRRRAH